jgi:hypothetical protein
MTTIPEIAARMRAIAEKIAPGYPDESRELIELAEETKRRSSPRAPNSSTPMTPELGDEIREYSEANPAEAQHIVAGKFNVNPGRISETLHGKRK